MKQGHYSGIAAMLVFAIFTAIAVPMARAQTAPPAAGSATGTITGKLTDEKGAPLSFANVIVEGTVLGAQSGADGSYTIKNVPAGSYNVIARYIGYEPIKKPVTVVAGQSAKIDIQITSKPITIKQVEIVADKNKVDVQSSTTARTFTSEEAKVRVVNNVQDALGKQAGVVNVGGSLYVRGGRSEEVKYYIDGFPVTDPLRGGASMDVSLSSLEDVSLLSGGFDAEYGNAQSGVVELTTKEGSPKFSGLVKYMTDDFGAPDKTYFNFDNLSMGVGGPTPVKNLAYYFSGEGLASDTYLRTGEVRARRKFLGLTFRERQRTLFSGQGKVTYKMGGAKLSAEILASEENFDSYRHRYSRVGYYSPTSGPGGNGIWWFEPLDSTFTYYNGPEHTPNILNRHETSHLRYTKTLGTTTFYTVGLGLHRFFNQVDVKGKLPEDYVTTSGLRDDYDPLNLFYVIRGDANQWRKQWSDTWTLRGDFTHERGNKESTKTHKIKTGFEGNYFDLKYDLRDFASEETPLGPFPDRYEIGSWNISAYAQDRFKYEGMVLNAGVRFDAYDPSRQAYDRANYRRELLGLAALPNALGDRLMLQVSPRLGMAYPISDRDVLHFHYGRFQEVPRLQSLYQYTGESAVINPTTVVGNPFLKATTTISYEVGIEHQFWGGRSSVNTTFFYKDQFGLIGTQPEEFGGEYNPRNPPAVQYVNLDYGSVQGVEFTVRKYATPTGRWSGGLTYTYSRAKGSGSSELQGAEVATGGQDRAPITEVTLDWDRPHVLSGNLYFQTQGVWGLNLEAVYSSGSPFTPLGIYDKTTPVELINTARLPAVLELSLKGDKRYKVYGQEFSLFLEGKNLTDRKNVYSLGGTGNTRYYTVFYADNGEFGGAYNLRDVRSDLQQDVLLPLNDPSVYDEPRSFKAGIQFDW